MAAVRIAVLICAPSLIVLGAIEGLSDSVAPWTLSRIMVLCVVAGWIGGRWK